MDHIKPKDLSPKAKALIAENKAKALALRKKLVEEERAAETKQLAQKKPQRTLMDVQQQQQQQKKSKVHIDFAVHNASHFQVQVKPQLHSVFDVIRSLPSNEFYYHGVKRDWMVRFTSYYLARKKFLEMKNVEVEIQELPAGVKKIFVDEADKHADTSNSILINGNRIDGLDDTLVNALFSFQRRGVAFGISKNGRVMIADEMGLGKSVQALSIALYYRSEWPLLIACPASVRPAWRDQILKFTDIDPSFIRIIEKRSEPLPASRNTSSVMIISYDFLSQKKIELLKLGIYVIIMDESHMLKEPKSIRSKAAKDLTKKANRVILLSGTPALSRPAELFTQIEMINSTLFKSFREFGLRYCDGHDGKFGFEAKGACNTDELTAILKKTIMIRRLKDDVLTDLPEKTRELVYLSGDKIDEKMASLRKLKEEMDILDKQEGVMHSEITHDSVMRIYQMTAEVKADSVAKYIIDNNFYESAIPRKILIFGHHMIVLDTIARLLDIKGIKYIRIDGKVLPSEREEMCKRFQERSDVLVAILGINAAGTGITLTAASKVIFAELNWNPTVMMQAEDRAHRIGQKNPVLVQYVIAKNTADDFIWPMLSKKLKVLGSVSLSSDNYQDAYKHHHDLSNKLITQYLKNLTVKEDAAKEGAGNDAMKSPEKDDVASDNGETPPKRPKSGSGSGRLDL